MKNNIVARVSVLETQYKMFYERFNSEVGEIRDILKGRGEDVGLCGHVKEIRDIIKSRAKRDILIMGTVVTLLTILFQWVLPKIFG